MIQVTFHIILGSSMCVIGLNLMLLERIWGQDTKHCGPFLFRVEVSNEMNAAGLRVYVC